VGGEYGAVDNVTGFSLSNTESKYPTIPVIEHVLFTFSLNFTLKFVELVSHVYMSKEQSLYSSVIICSIGTISTCALFNVSVLKDGIRKPYTSDQKPNISLYLSVIFTIKNKYNYEKLKMFKN
jgi:hypothetical protein